MGDTKNPQELAPGKHLPGTVIGHDGEPLGPASVDPDCVGPDDDEPAGQDPDYEEVEDLDPDPGLGDPAVQDAGATR